ncbi:hypothetical protein BB561_006661 [Smittium simulii]|uniref:Uncharacterized protein n=1 Tax=Smittium simulii TaxID=133385 RepID=A0A2T9Y2M1_9FUNG|nr:hypothetical protein BB561_006661 [Smittium simulii]
MKTTLLTSGIAVIISSFITVNGIALSGKPNQRSELMDTLKNAGLTGITCNPGYIGLDCVINDPASISKLSCYLKGKPSKSQGAVFIYEDNQNTGKFCNEKLYPNVLPYPQPPYPAPAPGNLRESCPLIVDIQKCMNKCVDDALK